ncbi:autoinducer binding domain-containing protein [Sphingomonas bacterium]|uniref:autoinducer binding domain-containing protein n=1 Tax=Sphingomonas bacterium TaxID=1895847 RepID=UPI0015755B6B
MIDQETITIFDRLRSTRGLDECAHFFRSIVEPLGFDAFACGVVDLEERDRSVFYIINWPERWRRYYVSSGLVNNDAVVGALNLRRDVYTWSDLRADRKMAEAGR